MRLTWNLTAQPLYLQTTQWLGTMPWRAMSDRFMQQVSAWTQPLIKWTQKEEEPFFIKAQEEERYHHFQAWRSDVRKQMRQLQQDIVRQYRQGKLLSPEHLRATLIAQQVNFEANTVSPLYYTRHLKRLAQRLPRYAHTFDGVAAQFKDYLKAQPEEAFRYFYNDLVNQLIDGSRESLMLTAEVRTALQKAVTYYQDIVPTALYEAVYATIAAVEHGQEPYQEVVKQLNALFLQVMEAEEQAPAAVTSITALEAIQEPLTAGWNYLRAHPKTLLWGAAAVLGASTLYRLTQENTGQASSFNWLDSLPSSMALPLSTSMITSTFSALPFAVSYLTASYANPKGMPLWQTAIPLAAGWFNQLSPVAAQTEQWIKSLGGAGDDLGHSVQQTTDGGYIVVGATSSFGVGGYDLWLSKWDSQGNLIWAKTLGGTSDDYGNSVQQTSDGGYIVTGYTWSFASYSDLWLSKWTANGTLSWVKTLGGIHRDESTSVQQTIDGDYIVTGWTQSFGAGNSDLWLSKWDSQGNLIWAKTLGGASDDYGYSVQQTRDGGYIVTGYSQSFGVGGYDLLLSKWTANGTLSWAKTLGGVGSEFGSSVQQTTDDGYIVSGNTNMGGGYNDLWLSKWAADGTLSWSKILQRNDDEGGKSVQQTADGGYIVTGYTYNVGTNNADILLTKWAADGSLSWIKTLGGAGREFGNSVQQTTDDGYIVSGNTNMGGGYNDLWLSKWDSLGSVGGDSCVSQPIFNSVAIFSVNVTDIPAIPDTPAVSPQALPISAQTINPILRTSCNDAPALSNNGGSFTYRENDLATVIDNNILVSDVDNTALISASVSISSGFTSGEDILSFIDQNGITGSYNSGTGILTLSGKSSVANYQAALRSITYQNTSDNPSTTPRIFSFTVNDGEVDSNAITRTADVTAVNDAPVLSGASSNLNYTENTAPILAAPNLVVTDVDNTVLQSATVSITANFNAAQDVLAFTDQNGISGSYNSTLGVMTLSGSASLAQYQDALRSVTYHNTSEDPTTASRTIQITVNDGAADSNTLSNTLSITPINDAPVLGNNRLAIAEGQTVILSAAELSANDVDTDPADLTFTISALQRGYFSWVDVPTSRIIQFTQQQVNDGQVQFTQDGSEEQPTYAVSVSDKQNSTKPETVTITSFTPVNDAPVVANPMTDQTVVVNETFTIPVPDNTFSDAENDPLTLQAQLASGEALPSWIDFDAANRRFRGTAPSLGHTRFNLFARDPQNATARTDFDIQVNAESVSSTGFNGTTTSSASSDATCDRKCINEWIGIAAGGVGMVATLVGGSVAAYKCYKSKQRAATYEFALNELELPHHNSKLSNKERRRVDHFVFVPDLDRTEADALYKQTGIVVKFESGATRAKVILGQGEFGKLRIAYNLKTHEFVGVKKIKGKAIEASDQERLIHERINGLPNVLPLLHSKITEDSKRKPVIYQFISLAGFGNGERLRNQLALVSRPKLKFQLVQHIAQGLLTGVASLHSKQVYHLDIKAQNMVVTQEGMVYVIDFGCARQFDPEELAWIKDRANGDSSCFAPERFAHYRYLYEQEGRPLGEGRETVSGYDAQKADAWSVGMVLLELLYGKHPFADASKGFSNRVALWDTQFMEKHLKKIFKEIGAWAIAEQPFAKALLAVIRGLLKCDPKKRISPKKALQADLFKTTAFSSTEAIKKHFQQLKTLLPEKSLHLTEVKVVTPAEIDHTYYGPETATVPSQKDGNYPDVYERTPPKHKGVSPKASPKVSPKAQANEGYELTLGLEEASSSKDNISSTAIVGLRK